MRNKHQLQALYEKSKTITFPKYNNAFEKFRSGLEEALRNNFGYAVAETLAYDEDNQCFWVKLTWGYTLPKIDAFPRVRQEVAMQVDINPTLPLLPQFQYIETCIRKLEETSVRLVNHYEDSLRG